MTKKDKLSIVQNTIIISGIFCSVVALLLLLNFWQFSKNDPVESQAMEVLIERLKEDPDNDGLKTEIRQYDLLARKAYFNSQWQVKTGAYILLFGAILFAIALRIYYALKATIEEPEPVLENDIAGRVLAQKGVLIAGVLVLLIALAASFATVDYLEKYNGEAAAGESFAEPADEGIEVIDVGSVPEQSADPVVKILKSDTVTEELPVPEVMAEVPIQESETGSESRPDSESGPVVEAEKKSVADDSDELTVEQIRKNHNTFRGPMGQGISYHKQIPTRWNGASGENVLWKSLVPRHGYNSPVIWGDMIFVAGADEQHREVYCYNRNNGKLLWTGKADNIAGSPASPPKVTEDTGLSAPTMTTDGQRVFAIFATGDVIAFSMNGQRLWARNLGVPDNHYGHSSSLITWDNKLFIQYDTNRGGKVMALDSASGETVWETDREARISWASPVLVQVAGKYQLILTADPIVAGYDTETGTERWAVECMMGEVGPSVGYSDGVVYAANEYAALVAIDIRTREIVWENDMFLPEAASPLAHDGLLFIATSYGVLVCYDASTGEEYWEHDVGKTLYSSPVYADGMLFLMDNDGIMRVYEYGREMKLISENELGETAGTTPAFADGRIYIRGEKHLYCIGIE
jgi:outer membrane protein assembly factor BamB